MSKLNRGILRILKYAFLVISVLVLIILLASGKENAIGTNIFLIVLTLISISIAVFAHVNIKRSLLSDNPNHFIEKEIKKEEKEVLRQEKAKIKKEEKEIERIAQEKKKAEQLEEKKKQDLIKQELELKKAEEKETRRLITKTASTSVKYLYGIDSLHEGAECKVNIFPEYITIESNNETFKINNNKIRNFEIRKDTEFTKQYVSSIGGAAFGAAIAGPLGMMFGGRAKTKNIKDEKNYLVISYENEDINVIMFKITNLITTTKAVKIFNKDIEIEHRTTEL